MSNSPAYVTSSSPSFQHLCSPRNTADLPCSRTLPFISFSLQSRSPAHVVRNIAAVSQSPPGHIYNLEVIAACSTFHLAETRVLDRKAEWRCWHEGNRAAPFHLLTCLLPGLPLGSCSFQLGLQHDKGDNAGSAQAPSCLSQHFYPQRSPLLQALEVRCCLFHILGKTSSKAGGLRCLNFEGREEGRRRAPSPAVPGHGHSTPSC